MRVKNVKYKEEKSIMIYISKQENNDKDIQEKIKGYKAKYKNVVVFVSGNNSMEEALEKIIKNN